MLEASDGSPLLEPLPSGERSAISTQHAVRQIAWVFLLALGIRAAVAPFMPVIRYLDAILFDFECIRHFAVGDFAGGYMHWVPPLFPAIVALPYRVIGDLEIAGRVAGCLVGALTVVPMYGMARLYGGHRIAIVAALLLAVAPFHVRYSVRISSHIHYAFFFAVVLWAAFALLRRPSVARAVLVAAAAGTAYWVRQEVVIFVALIVGSIMALPLIGRWWRVANENPGWLKAVSISSILVVVFAAYTFPIVYWTHESTGRWTMSSKGGVSLFGAGRFLTKLTPDRTQVEWETKISTMKDYQPLSITGAFGADPVGFLRAWSSNVLEHVTENIPRVLGYVAVPFLLFGLVRMRRVPRSVGLHVFGLVVIGSAIGLLSLFYDSPRLLLAYLPIGLMWAAAGALEICHLHPKLRERWVVGGLALALAAVCVGTPAKFGFTLGPSPEERAGRWIRDHHGAGLSVMDPTANVAYFADAKAEFTPAASLEDIVYFAGVHDVDFFAFVPDDIDKSHPKLVADFLDDGKLQGLELVFSTTNEPEDRRVHVFRVR